MPVKKQKIKTRNQVNIWSGINKMMETSVEKPMGLSDDMSTRDFIIKIGETINKKASDVEKYIAILEENWIENVSALKELDDL